ncbi:MAG: thioredoxin-dependent thiol peroxidase [Verrucomicrobiae bacterium]|nr:thioredoxin-dependent thiol peroxidase [Verrucomicrobiae bacterium]
MKKSHELKEGQKAPAFALRDDTGKEVKLADFKGRKVVLYFYPKDDTSGCTRQACELNDGLAEIQKDGAVVIGVSPDAVETHQKFKTKYKLKFSLLSDESKSVLGKYGVWKEKSMYGRKYMGVERTTLILDQSGRISKIFRKVKVEGHCDSVRKALREL